ncbi:hypothetical protein OSTOST_19248 [Ostertagia ostertagi]
MYDDCDEKNAARQTNQMIMQDQVDVIFGPTCNNPTLVSSVLASSYNIPMFTWGLSTSSAIHDSGRFPTVGVLSVSTFSLSVAVRALLHSFEWDQFAVIYSDYGSIDTACSTMKSDIENVLSTVAINYVGHLPDISFESVKRTMEQIKERARSTDRDSPFYYYLLPVGQL